MSNYLKHFEQQLSEKHFIYLLLGTLISGWLLLSSLHTWLTGLAFWGSAIIAGLAIALYVFHIVAAGNNYAVILEDKLEEQIRYINKISLILICIYVGFFLIIKWL